MGMDVYGKAPTTEEGRYFRRSVWGWHPLAAYVEDMHPALAAGCEHWHSNDGAGLNAGDSLQLANALRADIDSGEAARYIQQRDARLAALARVPCIHCGATGTRADSVGREMKMPERIVTGPPGNPRMGQTGWCNGCDGWGTQEAWETHYRLELDDVREFATFLDGCGGFVIN